MAFGSHFLKMATTAYTELFFRGSISQIISRAMIYNYATFHACT